MIDLDLDQLQQQTSGDMVVEHPVTGAATAARVSLAGPEHPSRKSIIFARMRARRAELERTGKIAMPDPRDDEADETELLAACTLGWTGISRGGAALTFSADAARALYADPKYRWLRDQVKAALDRRELFFGSSASA